MPKTDIVLKKGRPVIFDPEVVWPDVLGLIAAGGALSTALKRLDPAPSYSWAKAQLRENLALQAAYRIAIEDRADSLGSGLIDQSQKITIAAMQIADMNVCAHLS
jgi:hypothetical protein